MKRVLLIIAVTCVVICCFYAVFDMAKEPEIKDDPLKTSFQETEKDTTVLLLESHTEASDTTEAVQTETTELLTVYELQTEETTEEITAAVFVTETETETESKTEMIIESDAETETVAEEELSSPESDARSELKIPILMYHALTKNEEEASSTVITVDSFREQMEALSEAGYTSIFFGDLLGYVKEGTRLPEKPILITFDDGYLSNLTLAYPILDEYGHKATVAIVGITAGCYTYKDTGVPIYPHFSLEAAKMAYGSGIFDFQSHTYDMHQNDLDEDPRKGMLQKENESEEDYIKAIRKDFFLSKSLLESEIGGRCFVIVYPHGKCTPLADSVLAEAGAEISVTVESGISTVKMWDMSSLRFLCRLNMDDNISGEELILLLE